MRACFFIFVMLLFSCNNTVTVTDYDQKKMFDVEFLYFEETDYAKVRLLFSVDCFSRGPKSFALGPVDWKNYVLLKNCSKTTRNGEEYYYYSTTVRCRDLKTVSAGLDLDRKIYLTGEQMAGSRYFNSETDNFAFEVTSYGSVIADP